MIPKERFIKIIELLEKDEEYKDKLNKLTKEYGQGNEFCYSNNHFSSAFDITLKYALDDIDWMYDCIWNYILEGTPVELMRQDGESIRVFSAGGLYDFMEKENKT